jgi:hypothetical protein
MPRLGGDSEAGNRMYAGLAHRQRRSMLRLYVEYNQLQKILTVAGVIEFRHGLRAVTRA